MPTSLDLVTNDATWADWSIRQLDAAALEGPVAINDVIYTELSVRFATIEVLEAVLHDAGVAMEPMPRPALFLEQGVPALPGFGRQENRRTAGFLHRRAQCGGTPGFAHSRRMPGPITLANRRRHRHFAAGIFGLAGPGACGINDPDDPLTPGQQPVVKIALATIVRRGSEA